MDSRIYVAGHGGLIGSALVRMLRARGCRNVITCTRAELDLSNAVSVESFLRNKSPLVEGVRRTYDWYRAHA